MSANNRRIQDVLVQWGTIKANLTSQQLQAMGLNKLESLRATVTNLKAAVEGAFASTPSQQLRDTLAHMRQCGQYLSRAIEQKHKETKMEDYAAYVRTCVRNKGDIEKDYTFIRTLKDTTIGGKVKLAKCKKTGRLVAIKTSPLSFMCNPWSLERPLDETARYYELQDEKQGKEIPIPGWFTKLDAATRENIGVEMIKAWKQPKEARGQRFSRIQQGLRDKFEVSGAQARHLVECFVLKLHAQEFLRFRSLDERKSGGHQNIAQLIDDYSDNTTHYMVLELCPGGELFDHVSRGHIRDHRAACKLFAQLVSAVEYMHKRGICHLDLSLEQILLDEARGGVKLIDLGQARHFPENGGPFPAAKGGVRRPGKGSYMATEIWLGQPFDGEQCDVFCMGVILFITLVGVPPFKRSIMDKRYEYIASGRLKELLVLFHMEQLAEELDKSGAIDLIQGMLAPANRRITLPEIKKHRWVVANGGFSTPENDTKTKGTGMKVEDDTKKKGSERILQFDEKKLEWKIRRPDWFANLKLDGKEKESVLTVIMNAWKAQMNNTERLSNVHRDLRTQLRVTEDQATELMWYVFLELKMRQLNS